MSRSSRVTAIALSALTGAAGLTAAATTASATVSSPGRLAMQVVTPNSTGTGSVMSFAVADSTGGNYTPINLSGTVPPDPRKPVFSHDGKHIAFIGTNTAVTDFAVFIANADGSGCHIVVPKSPDQWHGIERVAWSADDSTLYLGFQGNATSQPIQIWQVAVNGTGLQQVPGLPQSFQQIEPQVLADGRLAYSDGGGNNVIAFDPKTKTSSTVYTKLSGFLPFELSPDGKRIALLEMTNQKDALDVYNIDGTGLKNMTSYNFIGLGSVPMAWSPDSSELEYASNGVTVHDFTGVRPDSTFSSPAGSPAGAVVGDVSWIAPTAQPGPVPTPIPTPTPTPNPTPGGATGQPTVHRIGGGNRYETGRLVSQTQWQVGQAGAVVLARGDAAPDALAGVPLAAHVHGPLLLTDPTSLDPATRAEIDRVAGGSQTHKTVYILGGKNAVSPSIEDELRTAGYTVVRYGGDSRYGTALQIAAAFGPTSHVIVATGKNFPDALSAGPLGAAENAPIVLSDDAVLDPATAAFIAQHQAIDPVGGQAQKAVATLDTVSKTVDTTLAGSDRYTTGANVATRVARVLGHSPATVGVASGIVFPDALTGGAYVANTGGALLLTDPTSLSDPTNNMLSGWRAQLTAVEIFGGEAAVNGSTLGSVVTAVNGRVV